MGNLCGFSTGDAAPVGPREDHKKQNQGKEKENNKDRTSTTVTNPLNDPNFSTSSPGIWENPYNNKPIDNPFSPVSSLIDQTVVSPPPPHPAEKHQLPEVATPRHESLRIKKEKQLLLEESEFIIEREKEHIRLLNLKIEEIERRNKKQKEDRERKQKKENEELEKQQKKDEETEKNVQLLRKERREVEKRKEDKEKELKIINDRIRRLETEVEEERKKSQQICSSIIPKKTSSLRSPRSPRGSRITTITKTKEGLQFEEIPWESLEIGKQIGTGAFAEVFEAFRCGERVAVKKFLTQSEDAKKEMEAEVKVMTKLNSGYVVKLYGACFKQPNLCIVMEFISRGSLFFILPDDSIDLSWELRWSIARDASLGINYLHSKKPPLLHRDMKSGNLLIGYDWRVKVCDFGQSEEGVREVKEGESCGGTARWTAPEVISGKAYTEAADVYSYGIILWELATRKIPFDDIDSSSLNGLVVQGQRPPKPNSRDNCPDEFYNLMKKCWDASPSRRPSFPEIVAWFRQQNLKDAAEIVEDPIAKLAQLQEQSQKVKSKREELDKAILRMEREADKSKDTKDELEAQKTDIDRKTERERRKANDLERQLETTEKKTSVNQKSSSEFEKKYAKDNKKSLEKFNRAKQQLDDDIQNVEKRFEQEKAKNDKTRKAIIDAEAELEKERALLRTASLRS